jgi:PAS domain S-box-containing protein
MNESFTILYVEDDKAAQKELKELLEDYFTFVLTASDGEEALNLFKNNKIDIVLTDILMPKMDGIELTRRIKKDSPHTPVIVITAHSEHNYLIECIKLRVDGYILKPFDLMELDGELRFRIEDLKLRHELRSKTQLLEEYKEMVDESTILSKADPKGMITYVNNKFCDISGFSKDELIGKNHNIVRHPDMPKDIFSDMWHTIKDMKKTWHGKVKNRKKDGSHYWVDATIKPILDTKGEISEFIALRKDITELENYKLILKNKLEDTSRSLNENINYTKQYEGAINNTLAVLKTDTDNNIVYANDYYSKVSGYSKNELLGTDCEQQRDEKHILLKDCDRVKESLSKGEHVKIVFTNVSKKASPYFVDTTIYPISDVDGRIVEHLHLMHDITELKTIHQEIESTQKEIVYKMGEIGESRSRETGNHVKRVAEYSKLLALLSGLSREDAEILFTASPMHDIGKVAIPDNILNKPGKLTIEEFEVMKNHAQIGYEVLKGSNRTVLKAAAIVAHEHHEKWDGSGYPRGLKGDDIHIFGRITAVADVFDALGHDRVYKKAWELERIYKLFQDERGKHFDPSLIDLVLNNKEKFEQIKDRYND